MRAQGNAEIALTSRRPGALGIGTGYRAAHPVARIHLLGAMRATSYLGDDILPRGKKARAMLAYLCFSFGTKVPQARLAAMLWGGARANQARASCRQALSELCAAMGPLADELIMPGRATVRFNAYSCWVDALALLESSSSDSERSDLAALCTGELLEGLDDVSPPFDRWLDRERTRLSECVKTLRERQRSPRPLPYAHKPLPNRNRLRVAVLPFEAAGSQKEQDLALSLSYEIAAGLTRFRWFDVVSPLSAMFRPPVNVTSSDLLERNQFDYAVDGVVTRHGRHFHISTRLLDLTRHSEPLWRERFELASGELHRLNEMVAARVVGSIDPVILFIEGQPKRREHYRATGLLLLAIPLLHSMERKKFDRAEELIEQALKIDPQDAMALAWSALWHMARVGQGWAQDVKGTLETAEKLSLEAIRVDPENAEALGIYAHICAWKKDFDAAIRYFDQSLRLNPNLAFIWALSAPTYCYIGDPDAALRRLKRYRELTPFHRQVSAFEAAYAIAYTLKGQYERAVLVGRHAVKTNPHFTAPYKPLIVSLGHLGRPDEAKPYIEKLRSLELSFTVERFAETYPIKRESDLQHYCEGLRLAGVPER